MPERSFNEPVVARMLHVGTAFILIHPGAGHSDTNDQLIRLCCPHGAITSAGTTAMPSLRR